MVNEALLIGFAQTHRHVGSILLDVLWKLIWLALTTALVILFSLWVYGELGAIELNGPVSAFRNPLTAMMLVRELWNTYASTVFGMLLVLTLASFTVWILLESYFRAGIFSFESQSFFRRATRSFRRFFALACAKLALMAPAVTLLMIIVFRGYLVTPTAEWRSLWLESRAPFAVSLFILAAIWFVLTTLEILARAKALSLLGPYLFDIAAAFAALWVFEITIVISFALGILIIASLLPVSTAIVLIGIFLLSIAVLTIFHGYLVAVRFHFVAALKAEDAEIEYVSIMR